MRYYLITHRSVSVKSHSNKNVKITMNTFLIAQIYIVPTLVYIYFVNTDQMKIFDFLHFFFANKQTELLG